MVQDICLEWLIRRITTFSKEIKGVDKFEKEYSNFLEEYLKVGQEK